MRAREPDREGFVDRDGVRLHYEVFGDGEPTLVLVPSNPIVHSRQWKAQVPFLARHYRVVTFDGRGNGRSDRPVTPEAHTEEACVADLEAVLAATCPEPAVLIGLCGDGVWRSLWFAADHPERVAGIVALSVGVPFIAPPHPFKDGTTFDQVLDSDEGWAKLNRHYWRRDYPGFVEFFFTEMFPEPHSTKQIEDCVGWAMETSTEVMLASMDAPFELSKPGRGGDLPADPVPAADRPRRRGPLPAPRSGGAAGGADRSAAGHHAGRRPHAPRSPSRQDQPAHQGLRRPPQHARTAAEDHHGPRGHTLKARS